MIEFDTWAMVKALYRQGWAKRKIARELGVDRKTVRKVLRQERPQPYQRVVAKGSLFTPYRNFIQQRVAEVDYGARRIFEELRTQDSQGSEELVKLCVRPLESRLAPHHIPPGRWPGGQVLPLNRARTSRERTSSARPLTGTA